MAAYQAPRSHGDGGGYQRLYVDHVLQADEGCDLDFLARPGEIPDPEARFS